MSQRLPPPAARDFDDEVIRSLASGTPTSWLRTTPTKAALPDYAEVMDAAEARFDRFAPWLAAAYPEVAETDGIIESDLARAPKAQQTLESLFGSQLSGELWLKRDDSLPVSGSIKARGGFHEVLEYAEIIAAEDGLDAFDPATYSSERFRKLAANHRIVVGSTGNLGLSIGILSAGLGFAASVHMSAEARAWKKSLLRRHGVEVIEHAGDFVEAVEAGRATAEGAERTHFVDDEDSISLFAGYSVAAVRLKEQFDAAGIRVAADNRLAVYLPCGIGGGPGGVTYGLKRVFGEHVDCVFVEPSQAPAMFVGVRTGLHSQIAVQDVGLSGITAADGLAVTRPSRFIGPSIGRLVAGFASMPDDVIRAGVGVLHACEDIDVEPAATAGLTAPWRVSTGAGSPVSRTGIYLVWLTGGAMVPGEERDRYVTEGLDLMSGIARPESVVFHS